MEKRVLTCIGCPMGCELTVELDGKTVVSISGYTCKRGKIYGEKEVTHPTRIVTTTVRVVNGTAPVVPVKTKEDIPGAGFRGRTGSEKRCGDGSRRDCCQNR